MESMSALTSLLTSNSTNWWLAGYPNDTQRVMLRMAVVSLVCLFSCSMSASKLVASSEYEAAAKLFQGLTTLFSVFTVAALSAAILPAGCYIWFSCFVCCIPIITHTLIEPRWFIDFLVVVFDVFWILYTQFFRDYLIKSYDFTLELYRRLLQVNVASIEEETEVTVEDGSELLFEHGEGDEKTEEEDGRLRGTLWMDNFVFNKLCHNIHYASDRNYLHKLLVDVNEYHNSRRNIWRSKLMRDYFGNPWATISLIAAVAHCQFTVVQYRCCEPNHKQGQAGAS